ncbi:MAG: cysteine dioxygenase [Actinophytocola sp.]|nr:cysteine dioxygenase [Actinophytocola sp.]
MFAVPDNTVAQAENPALRHPARVALSYATNRDSWRHLLRYDPSERFAALIERTEHDEIWLLSWLPGQHADLHDHGDTSGAFTVVSGRLTETVARLDAVSGQAAADGDQHELTGGQSRVFGPGYAHQVHNAGPDPAVSIHVYRYGSRTMRSYPLSR